MGLALQSRAQRVEELADPTRDTSTGQVGARDRGAQPWWMFVGIVALGIALRVWRALHNGPSFDESFTAMAGRRPLGGLVEHLVHADSHPPLDYVLRMPLARAGAGDLALRAPSLVFSCAALALFACWMRSRGWFGVIATALFSFSTFQILHGGEARMYALLQLLGVAAALVAERWLRAPRGWHAWCLGTIVLVALFDHVSGLLLGLGLLALCGLRSDAAAWRLRGALVAAGGVWALAWAPSVVTQLDQSWSSWVPRTTPTGFARTVTEQLVSIDGLAWVGLFAVVAGGVLLVRGDRALARLWLACGALPFVAAAVVGLASAFLLPRTLSLASWAPVLAVAVLLDAARRSGAMLGRAVAIAVPVLVLAASASFLSSKTWDYDLSLAQLERVAQPGDLVVVRPARYGILVDWRFEVRGERPTRDVVFDAIPNTDARRVLGASPSGRIWMLTTVGSQTRFQGYEPCAEPWTDGVTTVICIRARR